MICFDESFIRDTNGLSHHLDGLILRSIHLPELNKNGMVHFVHFPPSSLVSNIDTEPYSLTLFRTKLIDRMWTSSWQTSSVCSTRSDRLFYVYIPIEGLVFICIFFCAIWSIAIKTKKNRVMSVGTFHVWQRRLSTTTTTTHEARHNDWWARDRTFRSTDQANSLLSHLPWIQLTISKPYSFVDISITNN